MNGIFLVPTGIGCEIGGHAGDANPAVKLIASCCDILITHPNAVNASDINEMPSNVWYVEGSILDSFLENSYSLIKPKKPNRILVVCNKPVVGDTINAVAAARTTIGIDAKIIELNTPLKMVATMENNIASGIVEGWKELINQVSSHDFDVLALHTHIDYLPEVALNYFKNGGINPWGGVEAKVSKLISNRLKKQVAHAPIDLGLPDPILDNMCRNSTVDPRIAPEIISNCFLHSVLKGLHLAPKPVPFNIEHFCKQSIDFMVAPYPCWGPSTHSCFNAKIPIIFVKENKTCYQKNIIPSYIFDNHMNILVENYWEVAGIIQCWKAGVHKLSVRRPIEYTHIN